MAVADYNFATTQTDIIEGALILVNGVYEGQPMSAFQEQQGLQTLNQVIKAWQNRNVFFWTEKTEEVTLATGDERYALETDPKFLSITKAYFRDVNNDDCQIDRLSWADFQDIVSKTDTGEPTCITVDPSTDELVVWPIPTATENGKKLFLLGITALRDFESSSTSGIIPANWELALKYALAVELAPLYGVELQERNYLEKRANGLFAEAKLGGPKQITNDQSFVKPAFRTKR
jgi:hypothetical protein